MLIFDLGKPPHLGRARRSRGSVGERPLHTRKVAGSIPAGTTTKPVARCQFGRFPIQRLHLGMTQSDTLGREVRTVASIEP